MAGTRTLTLVPRCTSLLAALLCLHCTDARRSEAPALGKHASTLENLAVNGSFDQEVVPNHTTKLGPSPVIEEAPEMLGVETGDTPTGSGRALRITTIEDPVYGSATHNTGLSVPMTRNLPVGTRVLVSFSAKWLSGASILEVMRSWGGSTAAFVHIDGSWKRYQVVVEATQEFGSVIFAVARDTAPDLQRVPAGTFLVDDVSISIASDDVTMEPVAGGGLDVSAIERARVAYERSSTKPGALGEAVGAVRRTADGRGLVAVYEHGTIYDGGPQGAHVVYGALRDKYVEFGAEGGGHGYPVVDSTRAPDGRGSFSHFERGVIYESPTTGAWEVHGDILEKWTALGREAGPLGYPTSDERVSPDGQGRATQFEHGSIYWLPGLGAHEVHGEFLRKWEQLGGETGLLGYPISDVTLAPDGQGEFMHFQHGALYRAPDGYPHEVHGAILEKWTALDREVGPLGYPLDDEVQVADGLGRFQHFERGGLYWYPGRPAYAVQAPFMNVYQSLATAGGKLGYPIEDRSDSVQHFDNGAIYETAAGSYAVYGDPYGHYRSIGEHDRSLLGYPIADRAADGRQRFEHGTIVYDLATGTTQILYDHQPLKGATTCRPGNCNPCVNDVQAQFRTLTADKSTDNWPKAVWSTISQPSLPSGALPGDVYQTSLVQEGHVQGFVRTALGNYAFSFSDEQAGTISFMNARVGSSQVYTGPQAIHVTPETHPSGLFSIGRWVGLVSERTRVRFYDAEEPTDATVRVRYLPRGHEDAQPGQGAAMVALRGGGYLLLVNHKEGAYYYSYWSFLSGSDPYDSPVAVGGFDEFLGMGNDPGLDAGLEATWENASLITECGTGDVYAIHTGGDDKANYVVGAANTSGSGYWHLSQVFVNGRKPYLRQDHLGPWRTAAIGQDANSCWPRGGASANGDPRGQLHLVCSSRATLKALVEPSVTIAGALGAVLLSPVLGPLVSSLPVVGALGPLAVGGAQVAGTAAAGAAFAEMATKLDGAFAYTDRAPQ